MISNENALIYLSGKAAKERRLIYHKVFVKRSYEHIMPQFGKIIDELGSKWLSQRNGDKSVTVDFQNKAQALWAKLNEYNVFGNKQRTFQTSLNYYFQFLPLGTLHQIMVPKICTP